MNCERCKDTGLIEKAGIVIKCPFCSDKSIYGIDIENNKEISTVINGSPITTGTDLVNSELYTEINNIPPFDINGILEECHNYARKHNLEIVGEKGYSKLVSTLLEKSLNGHIINRSVLVCGSNGFGIDTLGLHLVKNYRSNGYRVPNIINLIELSALKNDRDRAVLWNEYASSPVLIVKMSGLSFMTSVQSVLALIDYRATRQLTTILLCNYSIGELIKECERSDKAGVSNLYGMLNTSIYEPYSTVVTADIRYKLQDTNNTNNIGSNGDD